MFFINLENLMQTHGSQMKGSKGEETKIVEKENIKYESL